MKLQPWVGLSRQNISEYYSVMFLVVLFIIYDYGNLRDFLSFFKQKLGRYFEVSHHPIHVLPYPFNMYNHHIIYLDAI